MQECLERELYVTEKEVEEELRNIFKNLEDEKKVVIYHLRFHLFRTFKSFRERCGYDREISNRILEIVRKYLGENDYETIVRVTYHLSDLVDYLISRYRDKERIERHEKQSLIEVLRILASENMGEYIRHLRQNSSSNYEFELKLHNLFLLLKNYIAKLYKHEVFYSETTNLLTNIFTSKEFKAFIEFIMKIENLKGITNNDSTSLYTHSTQIWTEGVFRTSDHYRIYSPPLLTLQKTLEVYSLTNKDLVQPLLDSISELTKDLYNIYSRRLKEYIETILKLLSYSPRKLTSTELDEIQKKETELKIKEIRRDLNIILGELGTDRIVGFVRGICDLFKKDIEEGRIKAEYVSRLAIYTIANLAVSGVTHSSLVYTHPGSSIDILSYIILLDIIKRNKEEIIGQLKDNDGVKEVYNRIRREYEREEQERITKSRRMQNESRFSKLVKFIIKLLFETQ